jgi:hypothetical protein
MLLMLLVVVILVLALLQLLLLLMLCGMLKNVVNNCRILCISIPFAGRVGCVRRFRLAALEQPERFRADTHQSRSAPLKNSFPSSVNTLPRNYLWAHCTEGQK